MARERRRCPVFRRQASLAKTPSEGGYDSPANDSAAGLAEPVRYVTRVFAAAPQTPPVFIVVTHLEEMKIGNDTANFKVSLKWKEPRLQKDRIIQEYHSIEALRMNLIRAGP